MIALSLDAAKNIAIVVVLIFVIGAVASMWLMKTIMQKVAVVAVLGLFVFAVWTQRTSLQDCSNAVKDSFELAGAGVVVADSTCSFFGVDVKISDPRGN